MPGKSDEELLSLLDGVLRETLAAEPSPAVAEGVRARVAAAGPGRRVRPFWWAAAAVAASVVAALVGPPEGTPRAPAPPPIALVPVAPGPRASADLSGSAVPWGTAAFRTSAPRRSRPLAPPAPPEVLVDPGQLEALPAFLRTLRPPGATRTVVLGVRGAPTAQAPATIELAPIEFSSIDDPPAVGTDPESPSSDSDKE